MNQLFFHKVLYYKFQDLVTKEKQKKKNFNEIKILCVSTNIEALNPWAFTANVRLVIVSEIPSIARFVKPYLPNNLY
jgi:hypothetical protein